MPSDIMDLFFDTIVALLLKDGYGLFWKDEYFVDKVGHVTLEDVKLKPFATITTDKSAAIVVAKKAIELYY